MMPIPGFSTFPYIWAHACRTLLLSLSLLLCAVPAAPAAADKFLSDTPPASIFPGADAYGEPSGDPPVTPILRAGETVGYAFLNSDHASAVGYSGRPIHILVALDTAGIIRGARLMEHHEPIVLIGIPEATMRKVISGYAGTDVTRLVAPGASDRTIDIISGATVTIMVIDDSILRASIAVARRHELGGLISELPKADQPEARLRTLDPGPVDWTELVAEGSVKRLKLTVADINRAFDESSDPSGSEFPEDGPADDLFIELYAGLVSIPKVGNSLLGAGESANLSAELAEGQHAVLLAGRGRYSFKGSGYVRGGVFDRFQLIQGDRSIRFRDSHHKRLRRVAAAGAPDFAEVDLFRIPMDSGFVPTKPWRIELLVARPIGPRDKAYLTVPLHYTLPESYIERPPPPATSVKPVAPPTAHAELWPQMWRLKRAEVVVLLLGLAVLSVVFFFQNNLVRHPRLTRYVRYGFLIFTAFGIGLYANAQLSIVNILAVFNALVTGFDWTYFLMEPLIFVLWGSAAVALVLWGRGAYCGWLCPFGALQELSNHLARKLGVPQWRLPWGLHERLWALKYLIFLGLFGVSLHSLGLAEQLAEIEPFKTAIVLKFDREWPFVLFAGALLLIGLFVERFYCRYLCGLGAALAIPGRMRTFDWLKRYRQCGNPCQRCANDCMVQAIHPEGHINPNECLYCLHCQQLYFDDHRCPVVIAKREKRLRREAKATPRTGERIQTLLEEIREGRAQAERAEDKN